MATYILLMTLTPEGRAVALRNPDHIMQVENSIVVSGVQTLGLYAVLGQYDFVTLIEAPNNEGAAKFSVELGVKAGVHITTLPVIPASLSEASGASRQAEASLTPNLLAEDGVRVELGTDRSA